ncbi:hypothetical protein [Kordiimonas aestuarii]|uniref:hypothetical protein n=1 Tax=Kordiimonas aestuarii TaxID=1005925 RepID=UPI0021D34CAE|nr:hypothetical protein [Kordiimonas aestuarii]
MPGRLGNKKLVFLFAQQRSGTGALSSLLNTHPECNYLGEVFGDAYARHPRHYYNWLPEILKTRMELVQPLYAEQRLHAYLGHLAATVPEDTVILDVKISQTHHFEAHDRGLNARPVLFDMVRRMGCGVIFLRRRNLLRAYLSRLTAEQSGIWHTTDDQLSLPKLHVDTLRMLQALGNMAGTEKRLDNIMRLFPEALTLSYETLFDARGRHLSEEACKAFASHVGLRGLEAMETQQTKLRPGNLSEFVENINEVARALTGTPHEWMLDR